MLGKNFKLFLLMLLVSAAASSFFLMGPIVTQIFIDYVIGSRVYNETGLGAWIVQLFGGIDAWRQHLWLAGLALLSCIVLQSSSMFLRGFIAAKVAENTVKNLKNKLYDHLQKLPYDYHVKAQTGDLIQRCTSDVETIRIFLQTQVIEMVRAVLLVVISSTIMFQFNYKMALTSLIFVPFIVVFSYIFFRYVRKTFQEADEKEGEMTTVLQEALSGIRVTRAFGRGRFEIDKFRAKNKEYRDITYRLIHYLAVYWSFSDLLCIIQGVIVLVYGVILTYRGEITVGELIMFNTYVNMMIWPLSQLGRVLSDTGKTQVASNRIYEILDTEEEQDTEGALEHNLQGDITFTNVYFAYNEDKPVFNNLSFHIKKGETIAILGSTGSGKSTLMHLLLRLYDYQEGSITINGKELREIRKDCLRKKIGMVLQEPFLYSKTIHSNLSMAKEHVLHEEIIEATTTAAVHDVIEEFDKGYETIVGEKGVTLSGGQKQRVAIARTLIKESDILIFDDSLSAVDTETDAEIRNALEKRNRDITTFIVSQRITTLMDADRIFVIDKGRLSDAGTHEELLNRDGLYSRIWRIQSMLEDELDS